MTELPDWWPNPRGGTYTYSVDEIALVRDACGRSVAVGRQLATDIGERNFGVRSGIGCKDGGEHAFGARSHVCMDCGISTESRTESNVGGLGFVKDKPTPPRVILGMQMIRTPNPEEYARQEALFVAASDGVFLLDDDGVFRECVFERRSEDDE